MANITRTLGRRGISLSQRAFSTSAINHSDGLTLAQKEKYYPKIGDRDIVGFGFNGNPSYMDRPEYPAPAIRFKENTADVMALREKEKGDWKNLSLEDKKALYRASFCQTYAEMKASTGEWKAILAGVLLGFSATAWLMVFMKTQVYPPLPSTITEEWKEKNLEMMVRQRQGAITGVSSQYDYEKGDWK